LGTWAAKAGGTGGGRVRPNPSTFEGWGKPYPSTFKSNPPPHFMMLAQPDQPHPNELQCYPTFRVDNIAEPGIFKKLPFAPSFFNALYIANLWLIPAVNVLVIPSLLRNTMLHKRIEWYRNG